ncbi:MAG: DUF3151 domain-containing protein [Acidimicrobiia bacterium]|nr:DUF3151 domain-containing protein [Acidimicrobiia bacterium]
MTEDQPISLSSTGPPETILNHDEHELRTALAEALSAPGDEQRARVVDVAVRWPRSLDAWAHLGRLARDDAEAYAAFRVGYHRGLDRLRQAGWRGAGFVRFRHTANRGFLRCLAGLQAVAERIGEEDEDERCALFLRQLDPDWPPPDLWSDD